CWALRKAPSSRSAPKAPTRARLSKPSRLCSTSASARNDRTGPRHPYLSRTAPAILILSDWSVIRSLLENLEALRRFFRRRAGAMLTPLEQKTIEALGPARQPHKLNPDLRRAIRKGAFQGAIANNAA